MLVCLALGCSGQDDLPPTASGPDAGPGGGGGGGDEGVRAFPGAEGFGALATGGRGGQVIKVTTLAATGPGSLQAALDAEGPRIVVFDVSGVIDGDILIPHGDVTIAGQTAPGGGVTIRGRLTAAYDASVGNIIIRHLRVRPAFDGSAGEQFDAVQISRNFSVILDHVSIAFGVDETLDMYEAKDVTVQYSTITSSATSGHPEGEHNYGMINGPDGARISVHHNLFAHHKNRSPAIANGPADIYNNVAYNVRHGFIHHNPASGEFNISGNYFRKGPSASLIPFYFDDENGGAENPRYFLSDNRVDDPGSSCDGVVTNPWRDCDQDLFLPEAHRDDVEHDFTVHASYVPATIHSSTDAYALVLETAGAFPRDAVTRDAIADTESRGGAWGANMPADLMAGLAATAAPADGDGDGMPDAWELDRGLDPGDPSDVHAEMPSGYPAIEAYINERADAITP